MSASPNWVNEENYTSLKTVLKWEIQHLLQRLADIGEEALLLTVCVKDGDTTEMGSPKGQGFLSMSELQNVKSQFRSYCQNVSEMYSQMEMYRDLSSGELSLGPKTYVDNEHRRKRRKKTYLQHAKIACLEERSIKQEPSSNSDDNSEGNVVQGYHNELESSANIDTSVKLSLPMLSMRSRRKRTPKKVVTNTHIEEDDNDASCIPENLYQPKDENFDNQSVDFYVKKSQSTDIITECQSESVEDFSINELPYKQVNYNSGVDSDLFKKKSTIYQRSLTRLTEESNCLSSLLKNTKDSGTTMVKKNLRKSTRLNSMVNIDPGDKTIIDSEKSMPVFPNLDNLKPIWLRHEQSLDVSSNDGESVEDSITLSAIQKDKLTNTDLKMVEVGVNNSLLQNERNISFDGFSMTTEKSSKPDKQSLDSSTSGTPSRKKGFKPVPADENPAETALLDSSKLGVGRYKCPMCGQTTRDRHDLKRHLRTHTKEKPYKCSLCGKKFTRKWDLENHFTRHNKSERDEANSKIGKQFNKTLEASNSEVLTYEKLVSKLLREKNISVDSNENENVQQSENEWIVLGEMKPQTAPGILGNSKKEETECKTEVDEKLPSQVKKLLSKKLPEKFLLNSKQEVISGDDFSCVGAPADLDVESTETDLNVSQDNDSYLEEKPSINGILPFETVLDSSLVTLMTDKASSVSVNDVPMSQ